MFVTDLLRIILINASGDISRRHVVFHSASNGIKKSDGCVVIFVCFSNSNKQE
jgi:hypothetical protein